MFKVLPFLKKKILFFSISWLFQHISCYKGYKWELVFLILEGRKMLEDSCFVNEKLYTNVYVGCLLMEIRLKLIGKTVFSLSWLRNVCALNSCNKWRIWWLRKDLKLKHDYSSLPWVLGTNCFLPALKSQWWSEYLWEKTMPNWQNNYDAAFLNPNCRFHNFPGIWCRWATIIIVTCLGLKEKQIIMDYHTQLHTQFDWKSWQMFNFKKFSKRHCH